MRIKVEYENNYAYIIYKNKKYILGLLNEYDDFIIKECQYEPIDTYVIIEEKRDDNESIN